MGRAKYRSQFWKKLSLMGIVYFSMLIGPFVFMMVYKWQAARFRTEVSDSRESSGNIIPLKAFRPTPIEPIRRKSLEVLPAIPDGFSKPALEEGEGFVELPINRIRKRSKIHLKAHPTRPSLPESKIVIKEGDGK